MAIGFGLWVLNGFSSFSWPFLLISFAFSMAGLMSAVGKWQRICGVLLCGVSGGMALIGFLADRGIEWWR